MKRLAFILALVAASGSSAPSLGAVCDASAFSVQACFPSLSAPVLAWPGGIGLPNVIAWASTTGTSGVTWGSSASLANAQAYITASGGSILMNESGNQVIEFREAGVAKWDFHGNAAGAIASGDNVAESAITGLEFDPAATNVAGHVAFAINNTVALTATAKAILDVANNGTDEILVRPTSGLAFLNTASSNGTDFSIGRTTSLTNLQFNVPTGDAFLFTVNNGSQVQISSTSPQIANAASTSVGIGFISTGTELLEQGNVADGASAVGIQVNNATTLTATSTALVQWTNNGTSEMILRPTTGLDFANTASPAAGDPGIGADALGGNLVLNAPTAKVGSLQINAVKAFQWTANAANISTLGGQIDTDHEANGGGIPTSPTAGTGCGTSSGPTMFSGSGDAGGNVFVTCGSAGTAGNTIVSFTFAHDWSSAPSSVICYSPGLSSTVYSCSASTHTFTVTCPGGQTCPTGTPLTFNYRLRQ